MIVLPLLVTVSSGADLGGLEVTGLLELTGLGGTREDTRGDRGTDVSAGVLLLEGCGSTEGVPGARCGTELCGTERCGTDTVPGVSRICDSCGCLSPLYVEMRRCRLFLRYLRPLYSTTYDLGEACFSTTVAGTHDFDPGKGIIRTGSPRSRLGRSPWHFLS